MMWAIELLRGFFASDAAASVSDRRMANANRLRSICHEAVNNPAWIAHDGKTFCNRSVQFIAQGMGYFGFGFGQLANDMLGQMECDQAWLRVEDLDRVSGYAMAGALVILGVQEQPHGHVVVAYPDLPKVSGNWGCPVPMVAQVGHPLPSPKQPNDICKLSEAIAAPKRPDLRIYVLKSSLA